MTGDAKLHDPYDVAESQQLIEEYVHPTTDQFAPLTGELLEATQALDTERAQEASSQSNEHGVSKINGNIEALLCSLLVRPNATLTAPSVATELRTQADLTHADWANARKKLLGADVLTLIKDSGSKRFVEASVDVDALLANPQDDFVTDEVQRLARIAQSGGPFDEADIEKYTQPAKPIHQGDTSSLRSARVPYPNKRVVFEFPVNDRYYAFTKRRGSYGHTISRELRYIHAIGFARQQKFRSEKDRTTCITRLINKGLAEPLEDSDIDTLVARMQKAGYLQPGSREAFGVNVERLLWPKEAKT